MDRFEYFQKVTFNLGDYFILISALLSSMVIGVYYAWRGVSNSTSENLMGRKTIGIFPIAMSLTARYY